MGSDTWEKKAFSLMQARHRAAVLSVPASWFRNRPGGCKGVM